MESIHCNIIQIKVTHIQTVHMMKMYPLTKESYSFQYNPFQRGQLHFNQNRKDEILELNGITKDLECLRNLSKK